jgi:WD40 repeat protein
MIAVALALLVQDLYGDPLPDGAISRMGTTRWRAHATAILHVPGGKSIASADGFGRVRLWEAATGRPTATFEGHTGSLRALAASADGKRLASAGEDKMVRIWEVETGKELAVLKGHSAKIVAVALSPDGTRIASASADGTVRVWEGAESRVMAGGTKETIQHLFKPDVVFSPDGKRVWSADTEHSVRCWEAATGTEVHRLKGHGGWISAVAISPDGAVVASASEEKSVLLWDAATGEKRAAVTIKEGRAACLAFSADSKTLSAATGLGKVVRWKCASGEPAGEQGFPVAMTTFCASLSPDGKTLVAGTSGRIRCFTIDPWEELFPRKGHGDAVMGVALSPDGKSVATVSRDNTVRTWETATGRERQVIRVGGGLFYGIAWSPDGAWIAEAGGESGVSFDKTVRIFDAATGKESKVLKGHTRDAWQVAFSPDGKMLASVGYDGTAKLWSTATWTEQHELASRPMGFAGVAFSPDGSVVATGGRDKKVRLWETASGKERAVIEGQAQTLAFSPDGKTLAWASGQEAGVRLWDLEAGKAVEGVKGRTVTQLAYTPDGKALVIAEEGAVRMWEVETRSESGSLAVRATSLSISKDGKVLVTGHADTTAVAWKLAGLGRK